MNAFARGAIAACAIALAAIAQDTQFSPVRQLIPAPPCLTMKGAWTGPSTACTEDTHAKWLRDIQHWRMERKIRIGYDGGRYELPEFQWTQSSFIQPQMMVQDRYFYDPAAGKYTVDRYLDDLQQRYGGIDAVLVWATYPNMGIDTRNQLEMVRSMPGGVDGVRQMVADFHRRGVRVPIEYAPDFLDFEEINDLFDAVAVLDLLAHRRPMTEQLPKEIAVHFQRTPCHNVVERRHAAE